MIIPSHLIAQINEGGVPEYVDHRDIIWIELPGQTRVFNTAQTKHKDDIFAHSYPYDLSPRNSGSRTFRGQKKIWSLGFRDQGSYGLGIVFRNFNLLPGEQLFVFDAEREIIRGAYTRKNIKSSGVLPVLPLPSDEIIIQFESPFPNSGHFSISKITSAFKPLALQDRFFWESGDCEIDILCPLGMGWQVEKRSVCRMIMPERKCTGLLVNNTLEDTTAYLLTARHCYEPEELIFDSTLVPETVFVFNYESPYCNGPDGSVEHSITGAQILSTTDSIDFILLKLDEPPPWYFHPYYAGWTTSVSYPPEGITIHHPLGDVKKISKDEDLITITDYSEEWPEYLRNSFWWIQRWDQGATEPGSSGSPLFDTNNRIIGTLTGGDADCANPVNDYYSRFDLAWDYYQDSLHHLKSWLDPDNMGASFLDGFDPFPVGIEKIEEDVFMEVFPNPSSGMFYLNAELSGDPEFIWMVFDLHGRLIAGGRGEACTLTEINLRERASGQYFLQIKTGKGSHGIKLLLVD